MEPPVTRNVKLLIAAVALVMVGQFVLANFVPYAPAIDTARAAGFTDDEIATGLQFTFERRFFVWLNLALELGFLGALTFTRLGRALADRWLAWFGGRRVPAALGVGLTLWTALALLYLPIGVARLEHSRAWGMTDLSLASWLIDYAVASCVQILCESIVLVGFYALLIVLPRSWWLAAPVGAGALAIAYAFLSPILVNPLFNEFTPLAETEWHAYEPRVRALIDKAHVPVQEILVMNASRQSKHSNAYFTGFGPTRRIVLYDNLLKVHTDPDEVDSVLAHEIGHWKHDHINQGILLGMLGALVGCYVLHRILRGTLGRSPWNLQSIADPAGLPLVLLLVNVGGWIAMPLGNLVSRHFERQADQASLELADLPKAFIEAERNLARQNKSNVAPTPWNVWLFATHPPTVERIRMAEEWKKGSGESK